MGIQLRETLRRFCDEIGWSYAVFWAPICRGDQMQLVWGDGYCEQGHDGTGISEIDANGHVSRLGFQAKQRVGLLVYKMLAPEIHVVGDGIVGQAALTGNHKWILHNALGNYTSVTKALGTMNHQFSAGIQTIAIIPVLPHGVLQIGSTQMVMENKEFINHVRSLFVELGTVPGALVSDASQKPLIHNILQNASLEASSTLRQPGDTGTYMSRFLDGRLDKSHRQFLQVPYSRSVTQPSGSIFRHAYCSMPDNSANMSSTTAATIHPADDPIYHHNQLESGILGSHDSHSIITNPLMTSVENGVYDLSSVSPHHVHILAGLSSNGQATFEEQLLSRSGSQEYIKKYWPKLDNYGTSQLKSTGCGFSTSNKDSDTAFPLGRSKSNNIEDLGQCSSLPCCTEHFESQHLNSSSKEVDQMVDPIDHSKNAEMLSKDSELSFSNSIQNSGKISTEGQQRNDYNIIHSLLESTQFEEQQSRHELLLGTPLDCWQSSSIPVQESTRSLSSVSGENHASTANSPNIPGIDTHLQFVNTETSQSPVMFTSGNGLFDLLDAPNKSRDIHGCLDDVFLEGNKANAHEMCADVSTCITQRDMGAVIDNEQTCCDGLFSQASPEQLLDAVVAQITSAAKQSFDDVSCKTSLTKSCHSAQHTSSTTSGWLGSTNQMHGKLSDTSSLPVKSEAAGSSSLISACGMDKTGICTPKDGLYKSKLSLWVEKGENVDQGSFSAAHGKKIDEVGKSNKKRSRPGENPRPRPKDRQMIQDRVKELREIVPNGAKCSIDALLEKTIKHMLFLQSVTKHADKLKEVGEPKIVSKEGGLLLKDNFDGGATWAFEIGTQSMICPIIVEDLNVPRQMLVEMLCEEQGLFLEIADLIRGLGLTILKGVLEARKDKVWARFAVEANRDVTRMEIFLSLVRLLEPNAGTSTVPDGAESFNKPHNVFHPFSLRAAGLSDCM